MSITLRSNNKKVLHSGIFLTERDGSIEFSEAGESIKIEFEFKKSDEKGEPALKGENISPTHIKISFLNFDDSNFGRGSREPIDLGTFQNRKLYFGYRIATYDDKTLRSFLYTFYTDI